MDSRQRGQLFFMLCMAGGAAYVRTGRYLGERWGLWLWKPSESELLQAKWARRPLE